MRRALTTAVVLLLAAVPGTAAAYSFIAKPTDQLGVPGFAASTEITPEGYLYTGSAETVFRFGPRLRPWNVHTRSLAGGRYPILRSTASAGRIRYTLTVFAAKAGGGPVDFVRVAMHNVTGVTARAGWAVGSRYTGGARIHSGLRAFRYARPVTPPRTGLYYQPGYGWNPGSSYAFRGRAFVRDRRALYVVLRGPGRGFRVGRARGKRRPGPSSVVGVTSWHGRIAPGRTATVDLAVPAVPVDRTSGAYHSIATARLNRYAARTLGFWRRLLGGAMRIRLPETKVVDTFYASLMNLAMTRYVAGGQWVQAVNDLQYHAFWLRDSAAITNAFDLAGRPDLAAQDLRFFLTWQQPDGLFISRADQYDGFGQALWALGQHVRMTRDAGFARGVMPSVARAINWLESARAHDSLGLLPPSSPRDNELVSGHLTGDNFWGVAGVHAAAVIARTAGQATLADQWSAEAAAYQATLDAQLRQAVKRTGGWIPAALDARGGQDWGNLWPVYPTSLYEPSNTMVTATMRHARSRFREGIATYLNGRDLHDYLGFRVFETDLDAGNQAATVAGLYSELAHTTNTNGGFETGVRAYGSRAVNDNMTPHGWYAAEYVTMLRNMLVREAGDGIVLMSALSPHWLIPGRRIVVQNAPTMFGKVSFSLRAERDGARLEWRAGVPAGTPLSWPLPTWAHPRRTIRLRSRSGSLRVHWRLSAPRMSYARTVAALKAAYRRHGH